MTTALDLRLTEDETDTVRTLSQLEQALFALHIAPVQERMQRVVHRIEDRVALERGAIGNTHVIDGDRLRQREQLGVTDGR